jgi:hypothetical protein
MFQGALSSEALAIAYWVEAILALLALATFLSIFLLRIRTDRHKKAVAAAHAQAQACLTRWLDNEPYRCKPTSRIGVRELLKVWLYRTSLVEGPHKRTLIIHGKAAGLRRHVKHLLRSGKVPDELLALKAAALLKEPRLVKSMLPLLDSKNNVVSIFAAEAIALSSSSHAVQTVLPRILQQNAWSEKKVVEILKAIVGDSPAITEYMVSQVLTPPSDAKAQAYVAKFLGSQPFELRAPYLSRLLRKATDDKVLSACLDGLREPASVELARQYLTHPRWHVRVHAIQAIGKLGSAQDEPALIKRLSDEQWWVRYRAAQALVSMPGTSGRTLLDLYAKLTDPYARDMLKHAASEQGYVLNNPGVEP